MPVRWRLTLFNALAIGGILILLAFSLYFLLRESLISDVRETVEDRALAAAQSVEEEDDPEEFPIEEDDAEELALDGVFILVRDAEGNVLTQTIDLVAPEAASDPVWRRALRDGEPASGTARLSEEAPEFVHAVPVQPVEGTARVVEAGMSYESVDETLSTFRTVLVVGVLLAFLLSLLGAYLLARAALSPVEAVANAAREITDQDLSKRLPVARPGDEIGRLTTTINSLLARLEAAFARREEALVRQRRFVTDASHELRTPLTSIGGYARLLEGWGLKDEKTAKEGVAAIRRESERMHHLVEGLLALARGDEGHSRNPQPGDLGAVVEEAAEAARAAAGGKVSVKHVLPRYPVEATFDKNSIRQAVSILLDNAVKYTPEGGSVAVKAFERDGWSGVEVEDTGVGIPEDQLPLVFERFHRADEARGAGGVGLGLSIARRIAESHGGRIEAESEPDGGSTFVLLLPKKPKL